MKPGTLYGIGIGPGDPELITLKGARLISACRNLFVPKARTASESVALAIARPLVGPEARIEELLFPMTADREELAAKWDAAAARVAAVLAAGEDACFLTLGDPLLYSTYIYLLQGAAQTPPRPEGRHRPGDHGLRRGGRPGGIPRRRRARAGDDLPGGGRPDRRPAGARGGRHRRPDEDRQAPPGSPRPPRRRGAPGERASSSPAQRWMASGSRPTSAA